MPCSIQGPYKSFHAKHANSLIRTCTSNSLQHIVSMIYFHTPEHFVGIDQLPPQFQLVNPLMAHLEVKLHTHTIFSAIIKQEIRTSCSR